MPKVTVQLVALIYYRYPEIDYVNINKLYLLFCDCVNK